MRKYQEYLANAAECERMARTSQNDTDKRTWQEMADFGGRGLKSNPRNLPTDYPVPRSQKTEPSVSQRAVLLNYFAVVPSARPQSLQLRRLGF